MCKSEICKTNKELVEKNFYFRQDDATNNNDANIILLAYIPTRNVKELGTQVRYTNKMEEAG